MSDNETPVTSDSGTPEDASIWKRKPGLMVVIVGLAAVVGAFVFLLGLQFLIEGQADTPQEAYCEELAYEAGLKYQRSGPEPEQPEWVYAERAKGIDRYVNAGCDLSIVPGY